MKILYFIVLLMSVLTRSLLADSIEFSPIIFIHGHSGDIGVEDTWKELVETKLNGEEGYVYRGKIWGNSDLPNNLSKQSLFLFGFYRNDASGHMGGYEGKIGGLPLNFDQVGSVNDRIISNLRVGFDIARVRPIFSYSEREVDFKEDYFDETKVLYAEQLKKAVDNVIAATRAKKVILVAHSMGGLVARSYVRWFGGQSKVSKILMVGTPNHGIADDRRSTVEAMTHAQAWQRGGEYIEMSARKNFQNKSYTDWLNDGWSNFCRDHNVEYATIAGNFDPWTLISIGKDSDGVIDSNSVQLSGAVFNAKFGAAHVTSAGFVPIFANTSFSNERALPTATFVAEVIKRWCIRDEVHVGGRFRSGRTGDPYYFLNYPNPFQGNTVWQYLLEGRAVSAVMDIYNHAGHRIVTYGVGLYEGLNYPSPELPDGLNSGTYIAEIESYDMNGKVKQIRRTLAKVPGINRTNERGVVRVLRSPDKLSTSDTASFQVEFLENGRVIRDAQFAFKLDNERMDVDNESDFVGSTFSASNLDPGLHVMRIYGRSRGSAMGQFPAVYSWIVEPINVRVSDVEINDSRSYEAKVRLDIGPNVSTEASSNVEFFAGNMIDIQNNIDFKENSHVEVAIA